MQIGSDGGSSCGRFVISKPNNRPSRCILCWLTSSSYSDIPAKGSERRG